MVVPRLFERDPRLRCFRTRRRRRGACGSTRLRSSAPLTGDLAAIPHGSSDGRRDEPISVRSPGLFSERRLSGAGSW